MRGISEEEQIKENSGREGLRWVSVYRRPRVSHEGRADDRAGVRDTLAETLTWGWQPLVRISASRNGRGKAVCGVAARLNTASIPRFAAPFVRPRRAHFGSVRLPPRLLLAWRRPTGSPARPR